MLQYKKEGDHMNDIQFSENLKTLRHSHHLTQEQLAEILNTTSKSISRWENGKTMPDYTVMLELSRYFHVSLDDLIKKTQTPMSNQAYHQLLSLLTSLALLLSLTLHSSLLGNLFYQSTAIPLLIPLLLLGSPLYITQVRYYLHHTASGQWLIAHHFPLFLILLVTTLILALSR